jgi:arylsulfatase
LGGFSLYLKDNHLIYECNLYATQRDVIRSTTPVPAGKVEAVYDFDREDTSNLRKGSGRLYINGKMAGQMEAHGPWAEIFGSFNIGQARVSPVSTAYSLPFKFTGTIEKVRVELK